VCLNLLMVFGASEWRIPGGSCQDVCPEGGHQYASFAAWAGLVCHETCPEQALDVSQGWTAASPTRRALVGSARLLCLLPTLARGAETLLCAAPTPLGFLLAHECTCTGEACMHEHAAAEAIPFLHIGNLQQQD
jgi:hypothetical protein